MSDLNWFHFLLIVFIVCGFALYIYHAKIKAKDADLGMEESAKSLTIGDLDDAIKETEKHVAQLKMQGLQDNDISNLFIGFAMGTLVNSHEIDEAEVKAKQMVSKNADTRRENKLVSGN